VLFVEAFGVADGAVMALEEDFALRRGDDAGG